MDTVIAHQATAAAPQPASGPGGGASVADWNDLVQATATPATKAAAKPFDQDSDVAGAVAAGTALGLQIAATVQSGNAALPAPATSRAPVSATDPQMLALTMTTRPNGDVSPAPVMLPATSATTSAKTASGSQTVATVTTSADGKTTAKVVAAGGAGGSPLVVATVSASLDPSVSADPAASSTAALAAGLAARSADEAVAAAPASGTESAADVAKRWADAYVRTYTAWVVALTALYGGGHAAAGTPSTITVTTTDPASGTVSVTSSGTGTSAATRQAASDAATSAALASSLAAQASLAATISASQSGDSDAPGSVPAGRTQPPPSGGQPVSGSGDMTREQIRILASALTLWAQSLTMGLVTPFDATAVEGGDGSEAQGKDPNQVAKLLEAMRAHLHVAG